MTTVAELYNEDDHTVNHHGFSRNVKEKDIGKVGDHQNPILNDKLNNLNYILEHIKI